MKKFFLKQLILGMLITSTVMSSNMAFAETISNNSVNSDEISEDFSTKLHEDELSIEDKVKPYQELVEKLNEELGSNIKIPKDENVYKEIIKTPLDETEDNLREAYKTCTEIPDELIIDLTDESIDEEITTNEAVIIDEEINNYANKKSLKATTKSSSSKNIIQTSKFKSLNVSISLRSQVKYETLSSGSGEYRYVSTQKPALIVLDSSENHFYSKSLSRSYSNQKRYCKVSGSGTMVTPSGYDLQVYKKISCKFDANNF